MTNLSRRSFFKGLASLAVAASVPNILPEKAAAVVRHAAFDPTKEYGMSIPWVSKISKLRQIETKIFIRNHLIRDARRILPPGTRYEIRVKIPTDYGRHMGMAWYRGPHMDERKNWAQNDRLSILECDTGQWFDGEEMLA